MWPEELRNVAGFCQVASGHSRRTSVTPPAMCSLSWTLCGRRLWGKPTWNGMQKEKKHSPSPIGLLTFAFSFQTTGCLELIYLGPNPLQPSHSSGKLSFLLCGLVCRWPSLSAGQVVTSPSPWNLRARFPKHLPTLSIAQNRSINIYLKLESLSTGKMCGDYMSPSPARAPENDRLGPWPEEGFGLIPKSHCCHGSHPWYELLTVSLEVLTTHRAVCKPEAASEGVAFLFADSGVRVRKTMSSFLRMFGYFKIHLCLMLNCQYFYYYYFLCCQHRPGH